MRALLTVVAALGVAAPAVAVARWHDPIQVAPPRIRDIPAGWQVSSDAPDLLNRNGTFAQLYVTSWRYRADAVVRRPFPWGGISIWISLMRSAPGRTRANLCRDTPHVPGYPPRVPPLRLPRKPVPNGSEEGVGAREYRVFGRYRDDYNFEVRADTKAHGNDERLWREAAAVVSRIEFRSWPHLESC